MKYVKIFGFIFKNFFFNKFLVNFFFDFSGFFYKFRFVIKNLLMFYFPKFLKTKEYNFFKFIWKMIPLKSVNASIVSKYICIRLIQKFSLRSILYPIIKHFAKDNLVKGFRIVCAGRFTKKDIATYDLRTFSSVPFSSLFSFLDFSFSDVVLKHSKAGIKVWLHKFFYSPTEKEKRQFYYDLSVFVSDFDFLTSYKRCLIIGFLYKKLRFFFLDLIF